MDNFRMDGYRPWLERATRVDDETDWSVHTIDYAEFKRKLRYFSKRRTRLRNILATSKDDSILASELDEIMGPPPALPNVSSKSGTNAHGMLLPTPRAHGRTTSDLMAALTVGSFSSAFPGNAQVTQTEAQTSYVAFPDAADATDATDGEEDGIFRDEVRYRGPGMMIPLQIETITTASSHHQNQNQNQSEPPSRERARSSSVSSFLWGPPRVKRRAVMRQVSNYERNDMMIFLAMEMDKAVMFYFSQWQKLSQQLLDYQTSVVDYMQQQLGTLRSSRMADPALQQLGHELLELEAFVVINLVTARQILIRYDAFVRTLEGTPMLDYYMKFVMMNPGIRFFQNRGNNDDHALLSTSFRKLLQHAELEALSETFLYLCSTQNQELIDTFQEQRAEFAHVLDSSEQAQAVASSGHFAMMSTADSLQDTFLITMRRYFLLGMVEDRLGYEPTYLISRGAALSKEIQILAAWRSKGNKRKQNAVKESHFVDEDDDESEESSATLTRQQVFNLVMTLLAAFFYCMNYYLIEPSSTMYVNALGGQDALSGALIGMMPMASFLAAFGYSIWTNHSFRQPFLVSCFLMVTGNLLYSVAFEYKSLAMAFFGRFMTGLGGPKCIVRRYMADTTSLSIRTSVNAGFGMVVAAGSAFGPGCAILLNRLNFAIPLPGLGHELFVNGMTGPGYLMALLWLLFTCALCFGFQEPDRKGLEEQKRLELLQTKEDCAAATAESFGSNRTPKRLPSSDSLGSQTPRHGGNATNNNDDLNTLYSGATSSYDGDGWSRNGDDTVYDLSWSEKFAKFARHVTFPVRICLGLLFAKVFVIETLVSATSTLSKNRYQWQIHEVGILGCVNGIFVIPLSILVGKLSTTHQDRLLMLWLLGIGLTGLLLLVDVTDLIKDDSFHYNEDNIFAVGPKRYVLGYVTVYMSIQSFEGIIGSALSKLIPTALATGTFNAGLLGSLVDTFGRTCGDLFICLCGFFNLRELMNLLFIPGAIILSTCLFVVRKHYDLLAV